ncbi:MAG TPA: sugar ABC transporter permease [Bacilli bacterium]
MENRLWWKWQYRTAPYLFIAPFFILFAIFTFYPFFYSFYLSFVEWNGSARKIFVGPDNYIALVQDHSFWRSLGNSVLIFFLYVPLMLMLALIFAVCLNKAWMIGRGFFRTAFFIPNVISVVAVSFVFAIIFNQHEGLLNVVLSNLDLIKEPIRWLETPFWAQASVALMVLYRWTGYNMLLLLAGLQSIPKDLYEAAVMDGANASQIFLRITVPLLRRILLFCTVLSTIGTFSLFTEPFILTKGGPLDATMTPVLLLYRESFQNFNFGYASSIAVCFFFLMLILTLLQMRLLGDKD